MLTSLNQWTKICVDLIGPHRPQLRIKVGTMKNPVAGWSKLMLTYNYNTVMTITN